MPNLKIAKPTKEDFDAVYRFHSIMEMLTGTWSSVRDWTSLDEDDEDYQILNRIRNEVMADEDYDDIDDLTDDDYINIIWKYIRWFFRFNPSSLARVIMCADIAMLNAFDNRDEVDTIEWSPKLEEAFNLYDEKSKSN